MRFKRREKFIEAERWISHSSLRRADSLLNHVLQISDLPEKLVPTADGVCMECKKPYAEHGWIIAKGEGYTERVCPGNWIVREDEGVLEGDVYSCSDEGLEYSYEPCYEPRYEPRANPVTPLKD